jgi:hypothetical protein
MVRDITITTAPPSVVLVRVLVKKLISQMRSTIQENDIPQTQAEEVLYHLLFIGRLSTYGAIREYGITRLAARVWELRKEGFEIQSEEVEFTTRHGRKSGYSEYYFKIKNNDTRATNT